VELIVRIWTFVFWIPTLASVVAGWLALGSGIVARPVPLVLWFLTALLLQFASGLLSAAWTVGLVAQSGLAIYLSVRLKLQA
jgi:hypothetical protein